MEMIKKPAIILVGDEDLTTADHFLLHSGYKLPDGDPWAAVYHSGILKVNKRLPDAVRLVRLLEKGLSREFLDDDSGAMPEADVILAEFGKTAWSAFIDAHIRYWSRVRKARAKEAATAFLAEHERELNDPDVFPTEWDEGLATALFREGSTKAVFLWAYHLGKAAQKSH